jgi:ribosomal protein S18 acetylase RimI-like enzyme
MKENLKKIAQTVFKDYQINRIYALNEPDDGNHAPIQIESGAVIQSITSPAVIDTSPDPRIRDHAWYAGEHAYGYGIWEENQLICMCWFWSPRHPGMPGRFSNLRDDELVLVDLITSPQCRGKGYALAITRFAVSDLRKKGYARFLTWVWHSNTPSIRVFTKAGWSYTYFLIELRFAFMRDYLRFWIPSTGLIFRTARAFLSWL